MRNRRLAFGPSFSTLAAASLAFAASALGQDFGPAAVVSNVQAPSGYGDDETPAVARDAGGHVVAVWESREHLDPALGFDYEIHVARSSDGGLTWTDPAILNSNAAADGNSTDTDPQVATDGMGNWVAIWSSYDSLGGTIGNDEDVLFSRSTDNGATWSAVAALDPDAATDLGNAADHPQIAADASGNMVVAWHSDDPHGNPGDYSRKILVSRSSDSGATWSAGQTIDASPAEDFDVSLATDGAGTWLAAWTREGDAAYGGDRDGFFARSTDAGASWSAPAPLNTNAAASSAVDDGFDLAAGGDGSWVAVWQSADSLGGTIGDDHDILVTRSTDDGLSWSAPAALNSYAATDSVTDLWPRVASDGSGTWIATWSSDYDESMPPTTDQDLFFTRSLDGGMSWTTAVQLSDSGSASQEDRDADLLGDGAGNWLAVWWSSDSLGGVTGVDTDILKSQSDDGGATWSTISWVNTNAPEDGIEYKADIATDGEAWIAVWESGDSLNGAIGRAAQYIAFARSTDGGASWSDPAPIAAGAQYDSFYLGKPSIATNGSIWIVTWTSSEGVVLLTRSTDDGVNWSLPAALDTPNTHDVFPALTTDGSDWALAWTSYDNPGPEADYDVACARSSDGGLTWSVPVAVNTNAAVDTGHDMEPQIVIDGPRWVVAWMTTDSLGGTIGTDLDIVFAISTDSGTTWSAPAPLNSNAASDTGQDAEVSLATDGAGNCVAAWGSTENLGGTIGADGDLLFARSDDGCETWSAPQPLNNNAATDSGYDSEVELATDASGHWVAVWRSTDTLGGAPGSDFDLLVTRSADNGSTWSAPETMLTTAAADSASDESPVVATDGAGTWITLWHASDQWGAPPTGIHPNIFASVASVCGGACDDGNPCTQDSCDIEGECIHLDGPALSCRAAAKGSLLVQDGALSWKLSGAAATSQAEFGDPMDTAAYALCVYDETGTRTGLEVPAAGTCGGRPCWKAVSTKGYGFKDKAGANDGVTSISLKGSTAAKTKVGLKASGASLPATSLPLSGSVAVQLHNSSNGLCWESVFTGADIRSDGSDGKFQAKAK